jgi:hypothetical protein
MSAATKPWRGSLLLAMPLKRPALVAGQQSQRSKVFVEAAQFDKTKLRFEEATTTKNGGTWIPIKYDDTRLLLHTGLVSCPFGASQYENKLTPTSFSMQISIDDDNPNALAVASVMKDVMDALKEHIPTIVTEPTAGVEYVDTCQQGNAQYAPMARVTLPLFKGKFTTQVVRRGKDPISLTTTNCTKVLGQGTVADGALRLAGAYYHEDDATSKARTGVSWQWHSVRLADENELTTAVSSERKAENTAVIDALMAAAPVVDDGKKKRKQPAAAAAAASEAKRAKTVHEDCTIEEVEEDAAAEHH